MLAEIVTLLSFFLIKNFDNEYFKFDRVICLKYIFLAIIIVIKKKIFKLTKTKTTN